MKFKTTDEFVHYHSPYFAVAFVKHFPMIAYLGIESGGRSRRHLDYNLLKPGLGAVLKSGLESSFKKKCRVNHTSNCLSYTGIKYKNGLDQRWDIAFKNSRQFKINISNRGGIDSRGSMLKNQFFQMAFAPEISPPTVWATPLKEKRFPPKNKSIFFQDKINAYFKMPLLLHFPDFGLLKIESNNPCIYCEEQLLPDKTSSGLSLGCFNPGLHIFKRTFHSGVVLLSFRLTQGAKNAGLTFTIEKEHYPRIKGCDFRGPKWNGLKRCWQNAFTLNPETLSMGDNILFHGIAHLAIHFKSDMSVFTPQLFPGLSLDYFFKRMLNITFKYCLGEDGQIDTVYAHKSLRKKDINAHWVDNNPSNLIALYNYLLSTGDWKLVMDNITNIKKAVSYLLGLDVDNDGIIEVPFDGNDFRDDQIYRNWWDNFAFGHKDAYFNLLTYRALKNMIQIFKLLKMEKEVKKIEAHLERFRENFNKVFFNKSTGVYAGWVSKDGKVHDYMFTFISAMAINEGLVDLKRARAILKKMLDRMEEIGYAGFKYGIPGPLYPVAKEDKGKWEATTKWGVLENGGLCGQTAYHFIQALYNVGLRKQADEILFTMLDTFENEPTHSGVFPGYAGHLRGCDWRTKEGVPCGYNYLADNYYFLLSAITGHYKVSFPQLKNPL